MTAQTGPSAVDGHWPLSVGRRTIQTKDTTHKATPAGAATPHGRGLAESKGHDRLMHSVERTSDSPLQPTCPLCGTAATGVAERALSPSIHIGDYRCPAGHIWTTRWLVA